MSSIVLVPIHLDALYLKYGQPVVEATADFSRLPYCDGTRDVYADTVNLSESIVSQPFQNQNLHLEPGIHLHWALPDALTKGVEEEQEIKFPAVPDRWLVIRRQNSQETEKWVVESNYRHPSHNDYQKYSITYPISYENENYAVNSHPFCYLGRKLTWHEWQQPQQPTPEYLHEITAIGYGEPTFAAFYPNCRSVFGFYDPREPNFVLEKGLEYDVIGWYSKPEQNYLHKLVERLEKTYQKKLEIKDIKQFIQDQCQWECQEKCQGDGIKLNSLDNLPQIICYARLTFQPTQDTSNINQQAKVCLAVGNTGSQALAAYLAQNINQNQKALIEEQLSLLNLVDSLDSDRPDFGAIFQQRVHQDTFNSLEGGLIWRVTVNTDSSTATQNSPVASQIGLPKELMIELQQLNQAQEKYNCAQEEIESMRYQLFSDWYKYMLCCYPPEASWDNYPDIDQVKAYIENCGLKPLIAKNVEIGKFKIDIKTKIHNLEQEINECNRDYNNYNKIVLHWKLDQIVEDQVGDASGHQRNATTIGKPEIVSEERFGRCIKFQEKSDRLIISSCKNVPNSNQITLQIWLNITTTDGVKNNITTTDEVKNLVVCQSPTAPTEHIFLKINQKKYQFGSAQGENNYASAAITDEDNNTWINLAAVYDGEHWILYKNGVEIARKTSVSNNSIIIQESWSKKWTIAADQDGKNNFQGQMAHLRFYYRALSSAEICRNLDKLTLVTYKLE